MKPAALLMDFFVFLERHHSVHLLIEVDQEERRSQLGASPHTPHWGVYGVVDGTDRVGRSGLLKNLTKITFFGFYCIIFGSRCGFCDDVSLNLSLLCFMWTLGCCPCLSSPAQCWAYSVG